MNSVLILGAGGFIGSAIVRGFCRRGCHVVAVSRSAATSVDSSVMTVAADRQDPVRILNLVDQHNIDTLVDVIPYLSSDTMPLISALANRPLRYVMLSSTDVYQQYGLFHRTESGEPASGAVTEAAPLREKLYPYREVKPRVPSAADYWKDHYDKIPIERAVTELLCEWVVFRLPMVYGAGDPQRRFAWLARPLLQNDATLVASKFWLDWKTTYGHVENIGDRIARGALHAETRNQIFNVCDSQAVDHHQWMSRFGEATGWRGEVIQSTDAAALPSEAFARLNLNIPFVIDGSRLDAVLGGENLWSLQACIEDVLASEPI